ncbi:MAG: metallophosphoesterase [Gammaproteobacteria bacterium]|nr:metallophosphoesterase [Gammaproteobacteria bacterium]
MKIQFFSDVHLEFGATALATSDADVIVAAGDVAIGAAGVPWLAASGKPTVYVAGNHEYYGGEMGAVQAAIRGACAGTNVRFLECESHVIDDVRFIGATLWTDFMGENAELMLALKPQMNDYVQIRLGERGLEPEDLVDINRHTRVWLERELARPHAGRTVVVTHHAPLFASWHQAPESPFKGAYCNNLSRLVLKNPHVDLWVHGHVHARADYRANQLRVVCNPRGYDGYQLVDGFHIGRTLTLA